MNWCPFSLVIAFALLAGCDKQVPAKAVPPPIHQLPTEAQPTLQKLKLSAGGEEIIAELAVTLQQIETGMMFRTKMDEDTGMLFVFSKPLRAAFWMKNCPLPLSAAYIGADGTIIELHDLEPNNEEDVVAASNNIQYVLETSRGWLERKGIRVGTVVKTERGSLKETFFPER